MNVSYTNESPNFYCGKVRLLTDDATVIASGEVVTREASRAGTGITWKPTARLSSLQPSLESVCMDYLLTVALSRCRRLSLIITEGT